jgi:Rps23 Pro-64 3,4-dihydroxylase Tpa1-like proline 4-hydroxylase
MKLQYWLNDKYLTENKINSLRRSFMKKSQFSFLELQDFLRRDKAKIIFKALLKEKFYHKESDLFKMKQTNDFFSTNNKILGQFRKFLTSGEFLDYLQKITNTNLRKKIDVNGSMYKSTDFLLPHDDRLEGRKIAFFYYLSNMDSKKGGRLKLFSSKSNVPVKVSKYIVPKFNKFAFFKVSSKSWHEVEEVKKGRRLAISGWFHG